MSANTEQRRQSTANWLIPDPGTGGALIADRTGIVEITGGGTRTLARPRTAGLEVTLNGAATITVEGGYNSTADESLVMVAQGAPVVLKSVKDSDTTYAWRTVGSASAIPGSMGRIEVPLTSITQEDGTVLAKLSSTTSGWSQLANKNIVLNIPVNATVEAFAVSVPTPGDVNASVATTTDITLNVVVSKAADNDELTLDAEMHALLPNGWSADLYDGQPVAITQSVSTLQYSVSDPNAFDGGPNDIDALSCVLTLGGTNDGDAVYIHAVYWTYSIA